MVVFTGGGVGSVAENIVDIVVGTVVGTVDASRSRRSLSSSVIISISEQA